MASRSLKNRVLSWLRRLRQPRYLLAVLVGGAYFYAFVARHWIRGAAMGRGFPAGLVPPALIEGAGAAQMLILVLLNLCGATPPSALAFTEPEVFMLFPAPVSRTRLINWKLLRGQIGAIFSGLILGTIAGTFLAPSHRLGFAVGIAVAFCVMQIYQSGIRMTKHALAQRGVSRLRRMTWALVAAAAILAACVAGAWRQIDEAVALAGSSPEQSSGSERGAQIMAAAGRILTTGPAGVVTWPARLLLRPALAPDVLAFLLALLPVAAVAALGYLWVHRTGASILEGALDAARRAAETRAAGGGGARRRTRAIKVTRQPFRLRPQGRQEVALIWKWVIALMRTPAESFGLATGILAALIVPCMVLLATGNAEVIPALVSSIAGMLLLITVLVGPQTARGMSQELRYLDLYRTMPLSGVRLLLGLIMAPVISLTLLQWFLILVAVLARAGVLAATMGPLALVACVAAAALLVVPINLLGSVLHSAASVLWPSWVIPRVGGRGGVEVFGLNIINSLARVLTLLVALLPAAVALLGAWLAASELLGTFGALALGAVPATGILLIEAWFGIVLLGRRLERLDPSKEVDSLWQHTEMS